METAMHSFLVSVPQAVGLWVIMLGALAIGAVWLARSNRPAAAETAEVDVDAIRYAGEVSVAAERAAATSARRRAVWSVAQDEVDAAWRAFDDADRVAREATKACAYPLMSRRRKPGENAERERYLHHAASALCRNRELSIAQLNEIYAHRGWNPRLHPVVQEAALRQAVREHRFAEYQKALRRERRAWQEAESAAGALRSLRVEAAAAVTRAGVGQPVVDELWWTDQWTTAELPAAA